MTKNYNILVVSHNAFSKVFNNGKTLEAIFSSFAKENLSQLFFSVGEEPDFQFCNNYFKLTDTDVLKSLLKGFSDCGNVLTVKDKFSYQNPTKEIKRSTFFKFIVSKADYLLWGRDILWGFRAWKSKSLLSWIRQSKPDAVFCLAGYSGFSHSIARFISQKYNIPLIVYFTDDYLIYPKDKNLLEYIQHNRIKKFYKKTVSQSSLCFAIGELMAKEYSTYFGKPFLPIMNSIKISNYLSYSENQALSFSYFGGLHLNRWKMLIRLANLIPQGTINVYCVQTPTDSILSQFKAANIKFMGAVSGKELSNAINNSDVLLHVESDDEYTNSITKLSVSTKIPEYLISGRLVVGFGPIELASMRVLSENNIGIVIASTLNDEAIKAELKNITENFILRQETGKRGYQYAVEHFDNEKISKKVKETIENTINLLKCSKTKPS